MNKTKRILSLLLALSMCLSLFSGNVWAADTENVPAAVKTQAAYSGSCGEHVKWNLDTSSGTMTISGSGAMEGYSSQTDQPWYYYQDDIRSVIVTSGVTSVGTEAFFDCEKLEQVVLSDSVVRVEDEAFLSCYALTDVTLVL